MKPEHEGPTVYLKRSILVCTRCKWLKTRLVTSGRDPLWEYLCLHPRAEETETHIPRGVSQTPANDAHLIGWTEETPDWCPLKKSNLAT